MDAPFSYDCFLSHNTQDKPRVRRLAERLREAGLRVWLDEWVIRPGDDIYLAVEHGLEASRVQVLCISPAALGSDWVGLERSTVLFRDPANAERRFIPLLLADCELPDALRRYARVDYRDESPGAFQQLLEACRGETPAAPPTSTPTPEPLPKRRTTRPSPAPTPPAGQDEPLAVLERQLDGHEGWVFSVAVSPDGAWAASGAEDKTVKVWDLATGACRGTLQGHEGRVWSVAITPDGKLILSGSDDDTFRVWDAIARVHRRTIKLDGSALSLAPLPDNDRVLVGLSSPKSILELWRHPRAERLWGHRTDAGYAKCVAVDAAGTVAVSAHSRGQVLRWDLQTGACLATLEGHSDNVNAIQITPDGRFAVTGSDDKTVKVWDLEAGTCIGTLEGHQKDVHSVALRADGQLIASTGFLDKTVRLWDRDSGACLQVIEVPDSAFPISAAFSPDGSRLVVGTAAGPILVYRITASRIAPSPAPTRRYVNAKVVLLGEGTVGKTSLAHRLIDDEYVVKDRTHGMNVWPLDLPLAETPAPDEPMDREALLWDLAGQEDYRLIHRLFLDETALALLLINPQKEDPFAEAGDWLKALDTAAGLARTRRDAARLLVFSQVDAGGMKLSDAKIQRFAEQYGFGAWLATSAKTGAGCSDAASGGGPSALKRLIAEHLPWQRLPWTATPRLLAELKGAVMRMRDGDDIRLLRVRELEQRLEAALPAERFDQADVRTAVTLLANHGLAMVLRFGDLVLLRPELLNGYASAVIRAARAHVDEIGCVPEAAIYDPGFDFTGVERLPRADEELLLRAMVQTFLDHSLCIAEETPAGRQMVFPSQYRREKAIPWQPDVFVSYSFGGEWQTIWTTLVVRLWYSQEFEHRELWRNAAEFCSSRGQLLGLKLDNRQGEGEATISLFFDVRTPDELKVIFIEYVHRHLAKYGCDVVRDRRYVCAECATPVTNLGAVRRRLAAGKDFITCQDCDAKVPLIDFIEQRLSSDPVARRILAMEERATQALDTQSLEQILIGHVQAITGEAGQIFRELTKFDYGIDGELEFKDDAGRPSGKKVYVQLKSGNSYLRTRKGDGSEVFDVKNERHLDYWIGQPVDVYLVIRQSDQRTGEARIRWMNVTRYLEAREDQHSRQIIFDGEELTMEAVWRLRDRFFPPRGRAAAGGAR